MTKMMMTGRALWVACGVTACVGCAANEPRSEAATNAQTSGGARVAEVGPPAREGAAPPAYVRARGAASAYDAGRDGATYAPRAGAMAARVTSRDDAAQGAQPAAEAGPDAEALGVLAELDRGEIEQGMLARTRAANPRVRSLGDAMERMHVRSTERLTALGRRLGVSPRESDQSRRLAQEAAATQQRLSALTGDEFDRAFVAAQVAQHTQLLAMVNGQLLPTVRHTQLREEVTLDVRPMVSAHLAQSRALQTQLGRR